MPDRDHQNQPQSVEHHQDRARRATQDRAADRIRGAEVLPWAQLERELMAGFDRPWTPLGEHQARVQEAVREVFEGVFRRVRGDADQHAGATPGLPELSPEVSADLQRELGRLGAEVRDALRQVGRSAWSRSAAASRIDEAVALRGSEIARLLAADARSPQVELQAVAPDSTLGQELAGYRSALSGPLPWLGSHQGAVKERLRDTVARTEQLAQAGVSHDALVQELAGLRAAVSSLQRGLGPGERVGHALRARIDEIFDRHLGALDGLALDRGVTPSGPQPELGRRLVPLLDLSQDATWGAVWKAAHEGLSQQASGPWAWSGEAGPALETGFIELLERAESLAPDLARQAPGRERTALRSELVTAVEIARQRLAEAEAAVWRGTPDSAAVTARLEGVLAEQGQRLDRLEVHLRPQAVLAQTVEDLGLDLGLPWAWAGTEKADLKEGFEAFLERAETLAPDLDRLPSGAASTALRVELVDAVAGAHRELSEVEAAAWDGLEDATVAARLRAALAEQGQRLDRVQERVLGELLSQGMARGELDVAGLVATRDVDWDYFDLAGHQLSSAGVVDSLDLALLTVDALAERHAHLAEPLGVLHERLQATRAGLGQYEDAGLAMGVPVSAQLEHLGEASRGMDAASSLAEQYARLPAQHDRLQTIARLFEAAAVFSDDAEVAAPLLHEAQQRLGRFQAEEGRAASWRRSLELNYQVNEALAAVGLDTVLDLAELGTEDTRALMEDKSGRAHRADADAVAQALAEARAALQYGELEDAQASLAQVREPLVRLSQRASIILQLGATLDISEQLAHSGVGSAPFLSSVDETTRQAHQDLATLLARFEAAPDEAARRRVMLDVDAVWHPSEGGRALFEGVLTAMSGLLEASDPLLTQGVAERLVEARRAVEQGELETAADIVRETLELGLEQAGDRVETGGIREVLEAVEAGVRSGELAQAGKALMDAAEAVVVGTGAAHQAAVRGVLQGMWDRQGLQALYERASEEITDTEWKLRIGVAVAAAVASVVTAGVAAGVAASAGVGAAATAEVSAWAAFGVGAGAFLAETTAGTLVQRFGEDLLLNPDFQALPDGATQRPGLWEDLMLGAAKDLLMLGAGRVALRGAGAVASRRGQELSDRAATAVRLGTQVVGAQLLGAVEHGLRTGAWFDVGAMTQQGRDSLTTMLFTTLAVSLARRPTARLEAWVAGDRGFSPEPRRLATRREALGGKLARELEAGADPAVMRDLVDQARGLDAETAAAMQRMLKVKELTAPQRQALQVALGEQLRVTRAVDAVLQHQRLGLRRAAPDLPMLFDPGHAVELARYLEDTGHSEVHIRRREDGRFEVRSVNPEGTHVRAVEAHERLSEVRHVVSDAEMKAFLTQEVATRDLARQARRRPASVDVDQLMGQVKALMDAAEAADPTARSLRQLDLRRAVLEDMLARQEADPGRYTERDFELVTGVRSELTGREVGLAQGTIGRAGNRWSTLVDQVRGPAQGLALERLEMFRAIQFRRATADHLLEQCIGRVETTLRLQGLDPDLEVLEMGSTKLTSDRDVSIRGLGAELVVAMYNQAFRNFFQQESGSHFDTNVYTHPVYETAPAHLADAFSGVGVDPLLRDSVRQFSFDQMKTLHSFGGPESFTWQQHRQALVGAAVEADRVRGSSASTVVERALADAEQGARDAEARLGRIRADLRRQDIPPGAELEARAHNVAYTQVLLQQHTLRLELRRLEGATRAHPAEVLSHAQPAGGLHAEYLEILARADHQRAAGREGSYRTAVEEARAFLAHQLRQGQGTALYFAHEAYQTEGAIAHVVSHLQRPDADGNTRVVTHESLIGQPDPVLPAATYLNSFNENRADLHHQLAGLRQGAGYPNLGKALEKAGKYGVRMLDAAHKAGVRLNDLVSGRLADAGLEAVMRHTTALEAARGRQGWAGAVQAIGDQAAQTRYLDDLQRVSAALAIETLLATEHALPRGRVRYPRARRRADDRTQDETPSESEVGKLEALLTGELEELLRAEADDKKRGPG